MLQKIIPIIFFLTIIATNASASVFDVLVDQDRYKDESKDEFDVTEGEEAATDPPVPETHTSPIIQEFEENGSYYNTATIAALNKITAKSKQLSIKVGSSAYFGNIEITVLKCWNNGDLYSPSNKILINVVESKIDEDPKQIFHGWIISSNIPVSVLKNPSYELIAVRCHDSSKK